MRCGRQAAGYASTRGCPPLPGSSLSDMKQRQIPCPRLKFKDQNMRPPIGTSLSGFSNTTSPSSSGTPSTSISDMTGPI